jgi:photosystem II stability/assembly factor-like uncharacterized protein
VVYAPNVPLLKSIDGGKSFQPVRGCHHGDHHDLWIDPKNPERMIGSNDGGVDITTDGGKTWFAPPLPITQFYHVHADNAVPYRVMGCMQDLGSASGPSNSLKFGGIGLGDWHPVGGGEAGWCVSDPNDPNFVYAGEYGGIMTRYDRRTGQARNITVNQWNPSGIDPAKHRYRFQWTAPILVSKHSPGTVYHAGNVLFRTRDNGQTWESVSQDLTRNDKRKQQWSGGPITGDNTGAETYCTIFAIGESPKERGLIWLGTDDGKVWLTRDECKSWTDVTANVPDLPDWGTVKCVEPSPHDAGTCFLVVDNHRMDDYRPHVWKTADFGKTWTKITDGLDSAVHCHAVREDPKKKGILYLGTERGVMLSPDAGKTWKSLQLNLPTVPVHDLQVKDTDLVVGTHGRAIWILDDLTVVREWTGPVVLQKAHLFSVVPAVRWSLTDGSVSSHLRTSTAPNPARGTVVWYSIGPAVTGEVVIEVLDAKGAVIARAKGKVGEEPKKDDPAGPPRSARRERRLEEVKAGVNRFVWDLTHDGAEVIPGAVVDSGFPGRTVPAAPGTYTIKLTAGGQTVTREVIVRPDPRWVEQVAVALSTLPNPLPTLNRLPPEDRKQVSNYFSSLTVPVEKARTEAAKRTADQAVEQEQLALRLRDDITKVSQTVNRLRTLQKQIDLRKELLKDDEAARALLKESDALAKKLTALEEKLHNPKAKIAYDVFAARGGAMLYSQLVWLLGNVVDGDGPPTKAQKDLADDLGKQLAGHVAAFEKLATGDVVKLNEAARKIGAPELYVPKTPAKKGSAQSSGAN